MASRSVVLAAVGLLCVFVSLTFAMTELSEEQLALMKQLHDMCVGETGVDEGLIDACRKGDFAEDQKLKCYMKCTYEQVAVIDDDGVIDADAMIAMLPADIADVGSQMIRKCQTVKGADACDSAFKFNKCLYDSDPSKFMMI